MSDKRSDYITWDEYFMGVAELSAKRSKDPSTQVGAALSARTIRFCLWATTDSQKGVPMMNSHGERNAKKKIPTMQSIFILPIVN